MMKLKKGITKMMITMMNVQTLTHDREPVGCEKTGEFKQRNLVMDKFGEHPMQKLEWKIYDNPLKHWIS